jgi:hypothetical protein
MIIKEIPDSLTGLAGSSLLASVIKNGGLQPNSGKMSVRCVLSTEDDDRSNDRVIIKGIDTSHHRLNPVALFNHDKNAPIGRFEDRLGNYTVRTRNGNELIGEVFFNQSSAFACDVFRAVESKVFTACSIGFMPTKIEKKHDRGNIYHASSLVEGSILVIGDNQRALVEFVEKTGSKMICKELATMLTPYIHERPASVVSGFTGDTVEINGVKYVPLGRDANADFVTTVHGVPAITSALPAGTPIGTLAAPAPSDDARRVFDLGTHREVNGWEIVKDEHAGVCEYVVRDPAKRTEAYRHGKWEAAKSWAELNSVPFDSATVKSWSESEHKRDHGKFSSTGGASGESKPAKEPHEMTRDEHSGAAIKKLRALENGLDEFSNYPVGPEVKRHATRLLDGQDPSAVFAKYGPYEQMGIVQGGPKQPKTASLDKRALGMASRNLHAHRNAVKSAIAEGKHVPDHVLADYPDLQKKSLSAPPITKTYLQRMAAKSFDESKHERDHGKFSSTGGASGESKPKAKPRAKPAAKPATPAPPAPEAAPAASDPAHVAKVQGTIKEAFNHQLMFDEHEGGYMPIFRLYYEALKRHPGLTVPEFHEHLKDMQNNYELELHKLNEVHMAEHPDKAIVTGKGTKDERMYYYVMRGKNYHQESKRFHAPPITKTYLQRMRIKAMNPEDDDTLNGAAGADQMPVDDTVPPDPNAPPVDPNADPSAEDMDGMTDQMKPFAQMCHTAHEQLLQITQGLEAALGDTEHPGAAKMAEKVKAAVGKAMATVTAAFGDYKNAHPDQPDIPGAEVAPEGLDDESEDEIPDDDEDTDDDVDAGDEIEEDEDDTDDEPKPKEKAWAQYSVKCLQNYWDYINSKAFAGDKPAMDAAAALLAKVAADKKHPLRNEARVVVKQLRGGIVTKAATATDDGWGSFTPEDLKVLQTS